MIRYLKSDEINLKKWDECIDKSSNSYIYANSWWLNIVADDWDALVEGDYESVFPLPFREKFGVNYLYQPVFTQQLGLFSKKKLSEKKLTEFVNSIPDKFRFAEINLNKYLKPNSVDFNSVEKVNIELDLLSEYNEMRSKYSTNLKRNLKKSEKNKLNIVKSVSPESLIKLFQENKGAELNSYTEDDYIKLGRLIYLLVYKGRAEVWGVSSTNNNLLAAALFVSSQGRYIFLFSGLSTEGREKFAMPFLIDSFINEKSLSAKVFDFEGSNDKNLARFYKSFGAEEFSYYHLKINKLPFFAKQVLKVYKKF